MLLYVNNTKIQKYYLNFALFLTYKLDEVNILSVMLYN